MLYQGARRAEVPITHPIGNVRLKAARQHAGYASQQALADALTRAAPQWGAPRLPDSPSIRMVVWKGEVIASTEEELLS
jgi:hypothetical protein